MKIEIPSQVDVLVLTVERKSTEAQLEDVCITNVIGKNKNVQTLHNCFYQIYYLRAVWSSQRPLGTS